jgi:hypothetical protein
MSNIQDLINQIQAAATSGNTVINIINITDTPAAEPAPVVEDDVSTLETDFEVGDEVMVCHTKKDGSGTIHPTGVVTEIDVDDKGPYVRVTADNDKHYRCGLTMNEERLGSKIIHKF